MKTWSQFFPFIEPEVMGCPLPTIEHHLKLACREFCERTSAWREWLDAVTADGTTNRFDYDLGTGQELVKVTRALLNGEDIAVTAGRALPEDWEDGTTETGFEGLVHFDDEQFMVFPLPTDGDVITLEMALKPTLSATGVGDILFTTYADDIAAGAKARLMSMGGTAPWRDPAGAAINRLAFEGGVMRAANLDFAQRDLTARRTKPSPI